MLCHFRFCTKVNARIPHKYLERLQYFQRLNKSPLWNTKGLFQSSCRIRKVATIHAATLLTRTTFDMAYKRRRHSAPKLQRK